MLRSVCFRFLKRPWRRLHWLSPLATAVVMVTGPAAPMAWRRLPAVPAAGHPALRLYGALLRPPPSWGAINGSNLDPLSLSCGSVGGVEVSKLSQNWKPALAEVGQVCPEMLASREHSTYKKCEESGFPASGHCAVQRIQISWPHCWGLELRVWSNWTILQMEDPQSSRTVCTHTRWG